MPRPARWVFAFAVAALGVLSAYGQLNPTVKVLPKAQSPVPPDCEQGLAPAQPRIVIAEAQPEAGTAKRTAAPPSLDLKIRLRQVQTAAEQDNREAFKAALAESRSAIASYPAGGERDAANEVIRVYEDLERLWDFSFSSRTGAFFDASTDNGSLVNTMRRYPDYAKSISDSTLNVGGEVIYPTRETRQFLTAEAARRLARLGVHMPARIPTPTVGAAPPAGTRRLKASPQPKPPAKREAHAAPRASHRKKPVKVAEATTTPPQPRKTEAPAPSPVVAPPPAPAPVPVPPPAETTPPAPATTTEATTTTAEATTTTAPPPMATTPPVEATAPSATVATTTTNPQSQRQGGGRMNLLFAIILIVIGIGVLIVLFRASD